MAAIDDRVSSNSSLYFPAMNNAVETSQDSDPPSSRAHAEADPAAFRLFRRRLHQSSNGVEYNLELSVVLLFQLGQLARELSMARQDLPHPNKRSHDLNV